MKRWISTSLFCVVAAGWCWGGESAQNKVKFERAFETGKDIDVNMVVGTNEQRDIIKINTVRFEERGERIVMKMDAVLRPYPHTDLRFKIELFDDHNDVLGSLKYNMHNRGKGENDANNNPEPVVSDFCPIGPKGLVGEKRPARFVFAIEQKELETKSTTQVFDICGSVADVTVRVPEGFFEELESAESEEAATAVLRKDWGLNRRAMANVKVKLKGKTVNREAMTDAEGKFWFAGLAGLTYGPYGGMSGVESYDIIAEISVEGGLETVQQRVTLDSNKIVKLKFRNDLITITGRVVDVNGQGIAGAKVVATLGSTDTSYEQYLETHEAKRWETVSAGDGYFELRGVESEQFYRTAAYLYSGRQNKYVDIHAGTAGYVQDKNDVPRLQVMSESVLRDARRFITATKKWGKNGLTEKEGIKVVEVEGNVMKGVEVVMRKVQECK